MRNDGNELSVVFKLSTIYVPVCLAAHTFNTTLFTCDREPGLTKSLEFKFLKNTAAEIT